MVYRFRGIKKQNKQKEKKIQTRKTTTKYTLKKNNPNSLPLPPRISRWSNCTLHLRNHKSEFLGKKRDSCNATGSISTQGLRKKHWQVCALHCLLFYALKYWRQWSPQQSVPSSSPSSHKDGNTRNRTVTVLASRATIGSSKISWTCRCRNANERWIIHTEIANVCSTYSKCVALKVMREITVFHLWWFC